MKCAAPRRERCAWPASTRSDAARWPVPWWPRSPSSTARVAKRKLLRLIDDSKKLTLEEREEAYEAMLVSGVVRYAVGEASVEEIDSINILQATFLAMRRALQAMSEQPDLVLIDGNQVPPRARLPRRDHRRRRRALLFDRCRLDHRQGHARPLHARAGRVLPRLRLGDQCRLRLPRTFRRASTGSAPRCTTAGASRRSGWCSSRRCPWKNRPSTRCEGPVAFRWQSRPPRFVRRGSRYLGLSPRRVLSIPSRPGPACPHMRVAEAPSPIGLRQVTSIRF